MYMFNIADVRGSLVLMLESCYSNYTLLLQCTVGGSQNSSKSTGYTQLSCRFGCIGRLVSKCRHTMCNID